MLQLCYSYVTAVCCVCAVYVLHSFMLIISVRQFTQNPNKYLTNLPIMLSRYGVPVAKITALIMEFKDQVPVPNNMVPKTNIIGQTPQPHPQGYVPPSATQSQNTKPIINSTNEEPIYDTEF